MRKKKVPINVMLPEGTIEAIDVMVGIEERYLSRSHFIRMAIDFFMIVQVLTDKELDRICQKVIKGAQIHVHLTH